MSTTNNTPSLTVDQLWELIDLAFPIKAPWFQFARDNRTIFYNPSRMSQRNDDRLAKWSPIELKKLKAIVKAFGYDVRIGEGSGIGFWPIIYTTAE